MVLFREVVFVSQNLKASDLSPYTSGRNIAYAVTRYFYEQRKKIEEQIKSSSTKLGFQKLLEITIEKLIRNKRKSCSSKQIQEFIDNYLEKPINLKRNNPEHLYLAEVDLPQIRDRLSALAREANFDKFSRSYGASHAQMLKELSLLESQIADPVFTHVPHPQINQEAWNELRPREREAATLELLGFTRDEISSLMTESASPESRPKIKLKISNRSITNLLTIFKRICDIDDTKLEKYKTDINKQNIPVAHRYIQRTLDFFWEPNELADKKHYTNNYSDLELAYIANNLLRRNLNKDSTGLMLKYFIKGNNVADIAKAFSVTPSTVHRNLSSMKRQIRDKFEEYSQIESPKGINEFNWVCLTPLQREVFSGFTAGYDTNEIAAKIKIDRDKVSYHLRSAYQELGLTRNQLINYFVQARLKRPRASLQKNRLLERVYGDNLPRSINLTPAQYKAKLFAAAQEFMESGVLDESKKYEFMLYLQGLDSGQINDLVSDDAVSVAKISSGLTSTANRIANHLARTIIAPDLDAEIKTQKISSVIVKQNLMKNLFPENTDFSLGNLGLAKKKRAELLKLTQATIDELKTTNSLSLYFNAFIHGTSDDELAKYFAIPKKQVVENIEKDFSLIRDLIKSVALVELPQEIKPEKFARLEGHEKLIVTGLLEGLSFPDILAKAPHRFGNDVANIRAGFYRACTKLEIDRKILYGMRLNAAVEKFNDFDFAKANLLRLVFGSKPINTPHDIDAKDYQELLQRFIWRTANETQTEYKKQWQMFVAGIPSPHIASITNTNKKKLQSCLASLKRNLTIKVSRFMKDIESRSKKAPKGINFLAWEKLSDQQRHVVASYLKGYHNDALYQRHKKLFKSEKAAILVTNKIQIYLAKQSDLVRRF